MRNSFFESVQDLTKWIMLGDRDKAIEELTVLALDRGYTNTDGLIAIQRGKTDAEREQRQRRSDHLRGLRPSTVIVDEVRGLTALQRAAL